MESQGIEWRNEISLKINDDIIASTYCAVSIL